MKFTDEDLKRLKGCVKDSKYFRQRPFIQEVDLPSLLARLEAAESLGMAGYALRGFLYHIGFKMIKEQVIAFQRLTGDVDRAANVWREVAGK